MPDSTLTVSSGSLRDSPKATARPAGPPPQIATSIEALTRTSTEDLRRGRLRTVGLAPGSALMLRILAAYCLRCSLCFSSEGFGQQVQDLRCGYSSTLQLPLLHEGQRNLLLTINQRTACINGGVFQVHMQSTVPHQRVRSHVPHLLPHTTITLHPLHSGSP